MIEQKLFLKFLIYKLFESLLYISMYYAQYILRLPDVSKNKQDTNVIRCQKIYSCYKMI